MRFLLTVVMMAALAMPAFAEDKTLVAAATTTAAPAGVTTSAPGASVAEVKAISPSIMDSLYLNLFSNFHGPSLTKLDSGRTVDRFGRPSKTSSIYFDSEANAAYMLTKDIGIGIVAPFLFYPVYGQGATLGDLGIKTFDKHIVHNGGLNIYANLIIQAPTSDYSKKLGLDLGLKTTPNVRYSFAGSRFSIGAWTEAKEYFGQTKDKTFKLWGAPYVSYQLAPSLSANLQYEAEAHHDVGTVGMLNFTSYQTDVVPSVSWFVTPKVMLQPYLIFYTTNRATADNSAIGALINATL